jgi:hypothetical protein
MLKSAVLCVLLAAASAFGQYKLDTAGPAPSELAPAIRAALQKDGVKIVAANGSVVCEVWLRTAAPSGPPSTELGVTLKTIPHGALLGAIRFPGPGKDRRGLSIKPGVYTLRLSFFPADGNHQGVAPQRDFLLMSLAADDTDLNAAPSFAVLTKMSARASGTNHPATLSVWRAEASQSAGFVKEGDSDWVLYTKIGDIPIGIILIGTAQG